MLVVEDDILVRHAIAAYLRDCGYVVIEAATSEEALKVLEISEVRLDAVLCAAEISGGLNGFQLRHWMRDNRPEVPMILSGNVAATAEAAAELCDDGPHVRRPYDPQGVVDYIKWLLGKRESPT